MIDYIFDSPFHLGIETVLVLMVLIALEAVLSADNAIALAALSQTLQNPKQERRALDIGLGFAYVLRLLLIVSATWVVQFWPLQLAGAVYLLWLSWQHFTTPSAAVSDARSPQRYLWQVIPLIALTDLSFSLDSVAIAIAISQELWLIMLGGTIGIVLLRLLAGLFIQWLEEFPHLEDAGYVSVALVGARLLLRVIAPDLILSEWMMAGLISIVFIWGFSHRIRRL